MGPKQQDSAAPVHPLASPYTDAVLEKFKADLQLEVESHIHDRAVKLEMSKAVIQMGQNALKAVFLMNAGAAGALLTFIGNLANNAQTEVPLFAESLTAFVIGLLVSGLASGLSYGCQWLYVHRPESSSGGWMNIVAVFVGTLALLAFAAGIYLTYGAFSAFGQVSAV